MHQREHCPKKNKRKNHTQTKTQNIKGRQKKKWLRRKKKTQKFTSYWHEMHLRDYCQRLLAESWNFRCKKSTYEVIISSRQHARVKFIRCPVSQPTERLLTLDKYSDSLQYCRPNLMILMKFEGFERNIQRFRALLWVSWNSGYFWDLRPQIFTLI